MERRAGVEDVASTEFLIPKIRNPNPRSPNQIRSPNDEESSRRGAKAQRKKLLLCAFAPLRGLLIFRISSFGFVSDFGDSGIRISARFLRGYFTLGTSNSRIFG